MKTKINWNWKNWIASVTDGCNCRCPGCYRVLQNNLCRDDGHMALKDFTKILGLFAEQGGISVDLVGGEPTLHPDFLEMVQQAVAVGLDVWVYSNLTRFGADRGLAKDLLQSSGEKVTVVGKLNVPNPLDPEQAKFQARLIGAPPKEVTEMWQGLKNLLAAGFAKGKIGVENLVRRTNIELAPQVYEVGLEMGFFVDLEIPTCPFAGGVRALRQWLELFPAKKQIRACVQAVQEINQRHGIPAYTAMMPHLTGRNASGVGTGCVSFKQGALLTERDGRVGLCTSGKPLLDESGRQLNLLTDLPEAVFSHPDLLARRLSCEQRNIKSGPCATCQFWQNCLGGCTALRETLGLVADSYPLCYLHDWPGREELLALGEKTLGPGVKVWESVGH